MATEREDLETAVEDSQQSLTSAPEEDIGVFESKALSTTACSSKPVCQTCFGFDFSLAKDQPGYVEEATYETIITTGDKLAASSKEGCPSCGILVEGISVLSKKWFEAGGLEMGNTNPVGRVKLTINPNRTLSVSALFESYPWAKVRMEFYTNQSKKSYSLQLSKPNLKLLKTTRRHGQGSEQLVTFQQHSILTIASIQQKNG